MGLIGMGHCHRNLVRAQSIFTSPKAPYEHDIFPQNVFPEHFGLPVGQAKDT